MQGAKLVFKVVVVAAVVVVVVVVAAVVVVTDEVTVVVMATAQTFMTHEFDWQSSLSMHTPLMEFRLAAHRCITQLPLTHCEGMLQVAPFAR